MMRFFAGVAACFLMMTGAFRLWESKAQQPGLPPAPAAAADVPVLAAPMARSVLKAPEASPASREQKRFARADKDDDGRITTNELFEPRRKPFAKLDKNGNGALSFEEWPAKTAERFGTADADRSGFLTPAEFAATAPKPAKRKATCSC